MMAVFMPMTSPRRLSSGPPELPGLIAASVWSISLERPSVTGTARSVALMTPTVTVCRKPNGLPIAITQSPAAICDESPNLASGSGWFGFSVSWISALSVSGSRPISFALIELVEVFAVERHFDLARALDDVVVREDQAVLADDEAGAGGHRGLLAAAPVVARRCPCGWSPRIAGAAGLAEEAAEQIVGRAAAAAPAEEVRQVLRRAASISVRMLTTIGDCAFATLRNVCASSAPVTGALFIGGTARVCADDVGVRSSRDAITIPTASDETAINSA